MPTQMHNVQMAALPKALAPEMTHRIIRIQALTFVWMSAQAAVSLGAAWASHSPALIGFGGDSAIEFLSAVVVLRRFQVPSGGRTRRRTSSKDCRRLALRFGSVRDARFNPVPSRAHRTTTQRCRDSRADCHCRRNASSRTTQEAFVSRYGQRSVKSRCC